MSPRFGLDFIEELLLSIAAAKVQDGDPEEAWRTARQRAFKARKVLLGEKDDGGQKPDDDEMELLEVGYWVWMYLDLGDKAPTEQPPRDIIRKAADKVAKETLSATKESRKTALTCQSALNWDP